jgi:hypothetical protein
VTDATLLCGAVVDADDLPRLLALGTGWYVSTSGGWKGYAVITIVRDGRKQTLAAHRVIMNAGAGDLIDHRDGDPLNNRKENLRRSDKRGNSHNTRSSKNTKRGGYKGVFRGKNGKNWRAQIGVTDENGLAKKIHLGCFDTPEDAARAYNERAVELFGEFAAPNEFPCTASRTVYLAGASAEAGCVATYAAALKTAGFTIAHEWWPTFLTGEHVAGQDRLVASDVRRSHAQSDLAAVLGADHVWLLVPRGHSTGAWVELGASLALNKHTIVSGDWQRTIFADLATECFDSHGEALTRIIGSIACRCSGPPCPCACHARSS